MYDIDRKAYAVGDRVFVIETWRMPTQYGDRWGWRVYEAREGEDPVRASMGFIDDDEQRSDWITREGAIEAAKKAIHARLDRKAR